MNNIFKNFSSLSKKTQQQESDSFIQKRQPVVNFNQNDFPELVNNTTQFLEKQSNNLLDYKSASLINDDDEQKEKKNNQVGVI